MADNQNSGKQDTFTEEIKISAEGLLDTIKELIHEGNVRHIQVKNPEGKVVFELPVTVGLIGIALLPVLAAIGAVAVLAADFTIVVTRTAPPARDDTPKG
ncbi:MAG: DUF4342 domain-containing protein [Fimbriimonas sp.]